nr:relaxase domain-containing protein [Glutamicibacter nicotianae]
MARGRPPRTRRRDRRRCLGERGAVTAPHGARAGSEQRRATGASVPKFATAGERTQRRLDQLPKSLTAGERAAQQALIEAEEAQKPTNAPVAGFDLTFSVPKSVSTLWAVADGGTQALVAQAHHAAIRDVIALLERDVAMTRVGAKGRAAPSRKSTCGV